MEKSINLYYILSKKMIAVFSSVFSVILFVSLWPHTIEANTNNLLINEPSLYLQQHASNPIHWHPWGKKALKLAKENNQPIFLSIGYSSCHWCHVMKKESFTKQDIADVLNKNFIAIKVDRERHPEVDNIYMTAVILMQRQGGWPLSVFLTPNAKPFYGGTYYPYTQFKSLLTHIALAWEKKPIPIKVYANRITAEIKKINETSYNKKIRLKKNILTIASQRLLSRYDHKHGGFGNAPKFPNESSLLLLLNAAAKDNNPVLLSKIQHTLSSMAKAGIYDQVGGGFHRYATDKAWQIPHFEKMLYNQSNLISVYLQTNALNPNPEYTRIISETLHYVKQDMQAHVGGFYTATDADSNGKEGEFFIWSKKEMDQALPPNLTKFAQQIFNITTLGNFEHKNILHMPTSLLQFAKQSKQNYSNVSKQYTTLRQTLYALRKKRVQPALDKKIITQWNGMMIQTFIQAALQFNNSDYQQAATRAATYLWEKHQYHQGRLWRTTYHGSPSIPGLQTDYAYLANAYCLLYDISNDKIWLKRAEQLTQHMIKYFKETTSKLYVQRAQHQAHDLILNPKSLKDSAVGSGNAQALLLLHRLYVRTGNIQYQREYNNLLSALSPLVNQNPTAYNSVINNLENNLSSQLNPIQYMAKGHVRLSFKSDFIQNKVSVRMNIAPGWHVNAHRPLQKQLVGTTITSIPSNILTQWQYPKATAFKLPEFEESLMTYQNTTTITARIIPKDLKKLIGIPIKINLQACNQQHCLAPETRVLRLTKQTNQNT